MVRKLKLGTLVVVVVSLLAGMCYADNSFVSAGRSWSGSWGPSDTQEKNYRLTVMDTQKKLETGFYDEIGKTTTNNYYDSSVGAITITGEAGANVDLEVRTSAGTGDTNTSTTIGAQNTSTTNVSIDGNQNSIDVVSAADSVGCQDGSIQISTSIVDSVDISASAQMNSTNSSGGNSCE